MQETRTWSPTWTFLPPAPPPSTVPTASWPRIRPSATAGTSPLRMCRSVPQIVTASTLTTASVSAETAGRGTSSQAFSPGPWYTTARMASSSERHPRDAPSGRYGDAAAPVSAERPPPQDAPPDRDVRPCAGSAHGHDPAAMSTLTTEHLMAGRNTAGEVIAGLVNDGSALPVARAAVHE